MTYLTGLARVARKTGYPVVEAKGWKTRGQGQMGAIKTIVAHHTAGPKAGNYPSLGVVTNGRVGLRGALSQYGIGRDGTIYVIAAGLTWHAGKVRKVAYSNPHAIGIEAENTGLGERWSLAQLDSYVKLCRHLVDEFGLSVNDVLGHKEVCNPVGRKPDPNFSANSIDMNDFRAAVKRGYWTAPKEPAKPKPKPDAPKPKPKPSPAPADPKPKPDAKAWPAVQLPVTEKHTLASDAAWRKLMTDVGFMGSDGNLTKAIQRWLTKRGHYDGLVDGVFGSLTVKSLQRFLRTKGLYLALANGKRNAATIKAEIKYLNKQAKTYRESK